MPGVDLERVWRASRSASGVGADDRIWAVLYDMCHARERDSRKRASGIARCYDACALRRLAAFQAKATPKNKRANFQPVIASSAPASGRSPWMKRAIRFSVHSGRISRDERFQCFSFSVRKLPLDCFATSLLAMTIQLDRRPLAAGANGGGIKAPSKPFSKLLQNSRVSLQAFPNKALAVLCDFKGLQGFQTSLDAFQNFRL